MGGGVEGAPGASLGGAQLRVWPRLSGVSSRRARTAPCPHLTSHPWAPPHLHLWGLLATLCVGGTSPGLPTPVSGVPPCPPLGLCLVTWCWLLNPLPTRLHRF